MARQKAVEMSASVKKRNRRREFNHLSVHCTKFCGICGIHDDPHRGWLLMSFANGMGAILLEFIGLDNFISLFKEPFL